MSFPFVQLNIVYISTHKCIIFKHSIDNSKIENFEDLLNRNC